MVDSHRSNFRSEDLAGHPAEASSSSGTELYANSLRLDYSAPAPFKLRNVGQRDMDPYEIELIHSGRVRYGEPRSNLSTALSRAIAGRPVYVDLDSALKLVLVAAFERLIRD